MPRICGTPTLLSPYLSFVGVPFFVLCNILSLRYFEGTKRSPSRVGSNFRSSTTISVGTKGPLPNLHLEINQCIFLVLGMVIFWLYGYFSLVRNPYFFFYRELSCPCLHENTILPCNVTRAVDFLELFQILRNNAWSLLWDTNVISWE